jgi:hypothetical protein
MSKTQIPTGGIADGTLTSAKLDQDGAFTFNEDSADVDFIVESNGNANMLFVSGGNDTVGVGAKGDLGVGLHIKSADTTASAVSGSADELVIEGTGNVGMTVQSANDGVGNIYFGDVANGSIGRVSYDHTSNFMSFNTNASERVRIDSNGNLLVGRSDNPSGVSNGLYVTGVYSQTSGSGANVFVSSEGRLMRSTSSLRYKNTIQNTTHGLTELLKLRPITYKGNSVNDGDKIFGGLIAEEVHEAGLTEFVEYNEKGEPDALAYGNMVSICIKAIQEQQTKIETLEAKVKALEEG